MRKRILTTLFVCAFVACSQTSQESTAGETSGSAATTGSEATATQPPAATMAPQPAKDEKPASYYQNKIAELKTDKGTIVIRFFPEKAPKHVKNFIDLAESGFYNGTKFHRVIPGFMIQGGDPNSKSGDVNTWGFGGSSTKVPAEFNDIHHARGIVSMAREGGDPNSASSQFFICVADAPSLDGQYSVFGEVVKGMDVADAIVSAPRGENDRPNSPVAIQSVTIRPATDAEKGAK